ncbi:MAG: DsrE/DsrF/DrsH-like family protein [Dehalococcoidales bacterium]|nr:DsrE/DsrF/DrsH-like family protein [Dehalococcoidales bacterium]
MAEQESGSRKVAIILHSGAYDRVSYALSIALVASASGMRVDMLVAFEGLRRFTRGRLSEIGEETASVLKESIERGLKSGGIQSLQDQLDNAKKLGVKIYACPNAMAALNIGFDELVPEIDSVKGLAAFLPIASAADVNWYI